MATRKKSTSRRAASPRRGKAKGAAKPRRTGGRKPAAAPAPDGATMHVRMYRQGLGDCFLLSFPKTGGEFHLLVDCGVFRTTANEKQKMVDVMGDVITRTNHRLDALAVTHEHYDHLIGFKHASETFDPLPVGEVWMSWVEGNSAVAKQLKAIQSKLKGSLRLALEALRARPALADADAQSRRTARVTRLEHVLGFGGDPLAANYSTQLGGIMDALRNRDGKPARLLDPHTSFTLPGVDGVRVFVLGPPQDMAGIRRMDDSANDPQTYRDSAFAVTPFADFARAIEALSSKGREDDDTRLPFEARYAVALKAVERRGHAAHEFFDRHYGFAKPRATEGEDVDTGSWRRIDDDWLGAADQLGLQLDSLTNNSSLALAIELSPNGPVVLMAADAQVGNWLSWHDRAIRVPASGSEPARTVSAADLLRRTVLYKVGHHGSHNATLRQKGLELMTSPALTAMIPTDEKWAFEKQGWHMPHAPLAKALDAAASGRVLRADWGLPRGKLPTGVRAALKKRTKVTKLYVDLEVPMR